MDGNSVSTNWILVLILLLCPIVCVDEDGSQSKSRVFDCDI